MDHGTGEVMRNDVAFNVLASYAYLYKRKAFIERCKSLASSGQMNLMIDSGAFTKHNAKSDVGFINVRQYSEFLQDMAPYAEKYVMMDVVGNESESKENYRFMLREGLLPMYVVTTFDKNWKDLDEAVSNNKDICVAGGVTGKKDWITRRYREVFDRSGGKARIHGLGYVKNPDMFRQPLASVDSSTWNASASRFGQLVRFNGRSLIQYPYAYRNTMLRGERLPPDLRRYLDELRVTPSMFAVKRNHASQNSIQVFSGCYAYIQYQKYAKRHGLDLFLAVGNDTQLAQLQWVKENMKNCDYERFAKEFSKK